MAMRVEVRPEMLQWARERARLSLDALVVRFPQLPAWERGERQPTFNQLEDFARAVHAPIGFFFLPQPPVERTPIPDFRTVGSQAVARPSPDLLDTIYLCQQRQEWYRDYARSGGEQLLGFVGAATLNSTVEATAAEMRGRLNFDLAERGQLPNWTEALRRFSEQVDALGVLIMVSGVVGSNNTRRLNPDEFRGFTLVDPWAPLIFVNGADSKAAQMFTIAHELAHVWLGESGISNAQLFAPASQRIETWCNQVAAELLVPLAALRNELRPDADLAAEKDRLARRFKVSTLVVLRRLRDAGALTEEELWREYRLEIEHLAEAVRGSGGNFYRTVTARTGKRFSRAVVSSTLEGQTLYRDALRLLGFSKMQTFHELGRSLGVL